MSETVAVATHQRPKVCRHAGAGIILAIVDLPSHQELHLSLRPLPGEKPAQMIDRLAAVLIERNAVVVRHEVFASIVAHSETMQALRRRFADFDWPVMWIEGHGADGCGVSGMHVFAVVGTGVRTIYMEGQPVGRVFNDGPIRHCLVADVRSTNLSSSRAVQSRATFERLEGALHQVGMNMRNVVRTWFYLDDILSWYKSFNAVRNEFYRQKKIFNGPVPASTGIGVRNPIGAAVVAGAWAIQAPEGSSIVREVPSPLQCPSLEYGSAFSRAILLSGVACRRLLVSGTASIDPAGRSAHVNDLQNQIGLTMEVVEALVASQSFQLSEVIRATAYFKNVQSAGIFDAWRAEHALKFFPLVKAQADICRSELLFEIELDAISHARTELDTKTDIKGVESGADYVVEDYS